MNVLFFAYPQYADFEIGHPLFFLRKMGKAQIVTVTTDGNSVESIGGLQVQATISLDEVDITDYDLLLISGGDGVGQVAENSRVTGLLQAAYSAGVPIAAICASAVLLAQAGLLEGKAFTCTKPIYEGFRERFANSTYTGAAVERSALGLLTAQGHAFAEFTVEMGRMINLWPSEENANWALRFSKGDL